MDDLKKLDKKTYTQLVERASLEAVEPALIQNGNDPDRFPDEFEPLRPRPR